MDLLEGMDPSNRITERKTLNKINKAQLLRPAPRDPQSLKYLAAMEQLSRFGPEGQKALEQVVAVERKKAIQEFREDWTDIFQYGTPLVTTILGGLGGLILTFLGVTQELGVDPAVVLMYGALVAGITFLFAGVSGLFGAAVGSIIIRLLGL